MSKAGTPTDNAIIEALNGWIKEELYLDFSLETVQNVPELLDEYAITSTTGDLRPPWDIKALFSSRPNWASNSMGFLLSTFA